MIVLVGQRRAKLTPRVLEVLLLLIKGHLSGSLVHKIDLGAKNERGYRMPSVLREQLGKAYDGNVGDLMKNDRHGSYGLGERVKLGHVDTAALGRLGNRRLARIAREIQSILEELAASAGNS